MPKESSAGIVLIGHPQLKIESITRTACQMCEVKYTIAPRTALTIAQIPADKKPLVICFSCWSVLRAPGAALADIDLNSPDTATVTGIEAGRRDLGLEYDPKRDGGPVNDEIIKNLDI